MIGNSDQAWRRVELRHVAALEAIHRTGSFRAAARDLGYSQAAVSGQVHALEEITGAVLVARPQGGGAAALTPAGRVVLHHGERAAAAFGAARADLTALGQSRTTIRVGVFPSVSARVLPGIVEALHGSGEPIRVSIEERNSNDELVRLLEAGALDVAFTAMPPTAAHLAVDDLSDDQYVLLAGVTSAVAALPAIAPREVARLPLIDYRELPPDHLPSTRLPAPAADLDVVFRANDNATVHELVARGLGFAIVPWLCVDPYDPRVTTVAIDPPLPPRRIAIAWLAERTQAPGLDAFRAAAAAAARTASRA